jgi:hypothetical protein
MGRPSSRDDLTVQDEMNPKVALKYGEVWHYRDEWHKHPNFHNRWASWDLYFDRYGKFVGWKLTEPTPMTDTSRENLANEGYQYRVAASENWIAENKFEEAQRYPEVPEESERANESSKDAEKSVTDARKGR